MYVDINECLELAEAADNVLCFLLSDTSPVQHALAADNKRGGYLCLADEKGTPLLICGIGEPDNEKVDKYFNYCQEKACRLGANPEHELSFQSRDPDNGKWGGAVRGHNYIASFSGLPERADELLSAMVLIQRDHLHLSRAESLLQGNPYLQSGGLAQLMQLFYNFMD